MSTRRSERGQALALIVLAIVVLFGFAALAVDLGRIYAERRRAQSAADAAALAAALAGVHGTEDPIEVGRSVAMTNGFSDDGVTNIITVHNPPEYEEGVDGPYEGNSDYYQVIIWQHLNPIFAQLVFNGNQEITTVAIAHSRARSSISGGNAIHALSRDEDALEMDGTTGISLTGGNMYSNGGGIKHGESGLVRVKDGEIKISDDWVCTGCLTEDEAKKKKKPVTVSPEPTTGVDPLDVEEGPTPYCPETNMTIGDVNYYVHAGISGSMNLAPGIHCLDGDINLTGGDVLTGEDVLIVMRSGGIKMKGNSQIHLKRADSLIDKYGNEFGGMLIFVPSSNPSPIALGGTSDSWFSGTIFAPASTCDIGGTDDTKALETSVICNKIKFHGGVGVTVSYKDSQLYHIPTMVELTQ